MLRSMRQLAVVATLLASGICSVQADQLSMPDTHRYEMDNAPDRGALESFVLKQYGEPTSKTLGVGEPAISSWTYSAFKVFFENGRVIHTVGKR